MFVGVLPPMSPTAEIVWEDVHLWCPHAWVIEAVPTRVGPWKDAIYGFVGGFAIHRRASPTDAHYAELAALNPGMRSVQWCRHE